MYQSFSKEIALKVWSRGPLTFHSEENSELIPLIQISADSSLITAQLQTGVKILQVLYFSCVDFPS